MNNIKRLGAVASTVAFLLMIYPSSYNNVMAAEINSNIETVNNKQDVQLKNDFYDAINHEWLSTTKIEDGKSTISIFTDGEENVTNQIRDIINQLVIDKNKYKEDSDEKKIINVYNNTLNIEARNKGGLEPVQKILDDIKGAETIDDITKLWANKEVINSTIKFSVNRDIKDVTNNILYIMPTGLSLGDSDEYTDPIESTVRNKKLTEDFFNKILVLSGYTKEEAKIKVDNMFKFEGMIAPSIKGKQEKLTTSNLIDSIYNVYTLDELNNLAPNLNLPEVMASLGIDKANKIVLQDTRWLEAFNKMYTQENLPLIKNYIEIANLIHASSYLTEDFEKANKEYESSLLGITGNVSKEEDAIDTVSSAMGMAIGKIYAERYVPKKTKEDVESITKEIVETYKKQIQNLDWMSLETKKNAVNKLDKLNVKIGYPKEWIDYSKISIKSYEDGGSLFQNIINLRVFETNEMLNRINKTVDEKQDGFKPQTVNAYYSANENSIIIPGGIIQGHFYNLNASIEVNLGGIGAIIGHEISHAFDNTGAQYDADGNLNNWWTEKDYEQFTEKSLKIAKFYSQIDGMPGEKINGYLTLGENIADIGGVSCLLNILKTKTNPDYKAFFESYATTWRQITTKEYEEYALRVDVHAPNKFRVNAVLPQFQEFYDTYKVTEKDGMYVKPEDRIGIW